MRFSALSDSRYLKKEDCGDRGLLVTIKEYKEENVAPANSEPQQKWVVYFHEQEKGLVLNVTNGNIISQITKCGDDSTGSIGHKIVLYNEPNVNNPAGKLVGGIRVRAPRPAQPPRQAPRPAAPSPPPQQSAPDWDNAQDYGGSQYDEEIPF